MSIVDDRGRVFGRVNLVDAILLTVLVGLIPLAYGAYALFRTPPPTLRAVEPAHLQHGPNMRVTIRGENLRPYMRVSFNDQQGRSFLFASTTEAQVELGTLSPGTYDVVLYDYAQERARLRKALTIGPPPLPSTMVVVVGWLANLTTDVAKKVVPGMSLGVGQVAEVGKPTGEMARVAVGDATLDVPVERAFRVPVTFKTGCYVQTVDGRPECVGAGVALRPDAYLLLPTPFGDLPFQVAQVRSPQPLESVEAVVRFVGHPAALALAKPGDVDLGLSMNELAAGAHVLHAAAPHGIPGSVADDMVAEDVVLLLRAQKGADGWRYSSGALRVGGTFLFRTPDYELSGSILRLTPKEAATTGR